MKITDVTTYIVGSGWERRQTVNQGHKLIH